MMLRNGQREEICSKETHPSGKIRSSVVAKQVATGKGVHGANTKFHALRQVCVQGWTSSRGKAAGGYTPYRCKVVVTSQRRKTKRLWKKQQRLVEAVSSKEYSWSIGMRSDGQGR